jgi:hypothetical protein
MRNFFVIVFLSIPAHAVHTIPGCSFLSFLAASSSMSVTAAILICALLFSSDFSAISIATSLLTVPNVCKSYTTSTGFLRNQ